VLGGGGLLKDGSCLKWLSYLTLFKLFGAKTMCYAVGVRKLRSHLDSIITRVVLNHFTDLITVRDGYSEQSLRDLGVKAKIVVTADAAISSTPLRTLKKNQIEDILEKKERPLIGVCLKQFEHEDLKVIHSFMKYEEYLAKIALELDEVIIENGGTLIMIPSMVSKFESDLKDILGVYSKMINKKKLFLIRRQVKPLEFHRIISLLDLVISQRLHPLIIASLANVPIIALPYAPKVRAHMEEIGLLDQCIDYNLFGHKILTKIVHTSLLNKEDLIKTLEKRTKDLYRKGKMNLSLMKMLLNNS
jgi:polysaccharide pyruvyl transferase WcaK-like protein